MNTLALRTIAGIVYVAIIVASLVTPPIFFMILLVLFACCGIAEFDNIARSVCNTSRLIRGWDSVTAAAIVMMSYMAAEVAGTPGSSFPALTFAAPVIFCLLVRGLIQIYTPHQNAILSTACSMMSLVYVAAPLSLLPMVYFIYGTPMLILSMFIMIWMSDTGAFVVGSLIGCHKLFERLSPKKSWEGFAGGLIFTVASAWGIHAWLPGWTAGLSLPAMLGLGLVVSVFGTWGDLFESMLKRTAGVKDSGHLIPGHGGILDRIDSLLLVAPATLVYLILIA